MAWMWVQSQETDTAPVRIAIAWRLPEALVNVEPLPIGATLIVQGPRVLIRRAQTERPTMVIDLRDEDIGRRDVRLDAYDIEQMPSGLSVVAFSPQEVTVSLDEPSVRHVPVMPRHVGRPAQEHALEGLSLSPEVVEVTGPRTLVDRIDKVWTLPVDISGWTETKSVPVALDLPRGVQAANRWSGEVAVSIASLTAQRTVVGIPVMTWGRNDWEPVEGSATVSLTLKGPTDVLRALSTDDIAVRVKLPDNNEGRDAYVAPFRADRPPSFDVVLPRADVITVVEAPPTVEVVRR